MSNFPNEALFQRPAPLFNRSGGHLSLALLLWLAWPIGLLTQGVTQPMPLPEIDVKPGTWNASREDITAVYRSAAAQIWQHLGETNRLPEIEVSRSKSGPIVLFKRGPKGEYRVRIDSNGTYWSQHAFQFAHEFGHILCNYREGGKHVKWFEESLCELASLFCLRSMGQAWASKAPYPNWAGYGKHLTKYAQNRIDAANRQLGKQTLPDWYQQQAKTLRGDCCKRDLNTIVAVNLLPVFEADARRWRAVRYLNRRPWDELPDFKSLLRAWETDCPAELKVVVREIRRKLLGSADPSARRHSRKACFYSPRTGYFFQNEGENSMMTAKISRRPINIRNDSSHFPRSGRC